MKRPRFGIGPAMAWIALVAIALGFAVGSPRGAAPKRSQSIRVDRPPARIGLDLAGVVQGGALLLGLAGLLRRLGVKGTGPDRGPGVEAGKTNPSPVA